MTTLYRETMITPSNTTDGEWVARQDGATDVWALDAWMDAVRDNGADEIIELEDGATLPAGVEDIRGRIHNQPSRVYAVIMRDGGIRYTGLAQVE